MLEHNGEIFNAYRYATTVDRSVTGVHICQELTDNSIQYDANEVWVIVDSFNNRIVTADTGTGIPEEIFCDNYHTFHNEPKDASGISMAGLGSKLFYKLSDTRITLTKHNGNAYYSIWRFTTQEEFANPTMDYFDGENIPESLQDHEDIVKQFFQCESNCTFTILPEIKTWGKYGTSSGRFYNTLQNHYAERYGHFLKSHPLNLVVSYVDSNDKREWHRIPTADIFNKVSYSSATNAAGNIEVRSWIVNPTLEQSKLSKCGINVYRNDVKALTTGFLNIGQRKKRGKTISIIKASPLDYKSIRQAVFFKSESDDDFVINHIKTQIEFGDEIEQLCATEFKKIVNQYETQRSVAHESKVTETIEESSDLTFAIEELADAVAWQSSGGQITINKASKVYDTIEAMSEDGIDLIKSILASIPSRQVNHLGKHLETNLGVTSVQ